MPHCTSLKLGTSRSFGRPLTGLWVFGLAKLCDGLGELWTDARLVLAEDRACAREGGTNVLERLGVPDQAGPVFGEEELALVTGEQLVQALALVLVRGGVSQHH